MVRVRAEPGLARAMWREQRLVMEEIGESDVVRAEIGERDVVREEIGERDFL